jgi:hypothetical protein
LQRALDYGSKFDGIDVILGGLEESEEREDLLQI